MGPIELTAEERAEVDALLADLPLRDRCDPDPFLSCDPCVVPTLDVDGDELSTDCCGDLPDEDADAIQAFMDLIDDLAVAALEP